jgi:hypothetical protein
MADRTDRPKPDTGAVSGTSDNAIQGSLQTVRAAMGGPGSFALSNLSSRAPSRFLRVASRPLTGVGARTTGRPVHRELARVQHHGLGISRARLADPRRAGHSLPRRADSLRQASPGPLSSQ